MTSSQNNITQRHWLLESTVGRNLLYASLRVNTEGKAPAYPGRGAQYDALLDRQIDLLALRDLGRPSGWFAMKLMEYRLLGKQIQLAWRYKNKSANKPTDQV